MGRKKPRYCKVDLDWEQDEKVILLADLQSGPASRNKALLSWVRLMCLMAQFGGSVDMKDACIRAKAKREMDMTENKLREFLDQCADCGLINKEAYMELDRVGSDRSVKDAQAAERRRTFALEREKRKRESLQESEEET